LKDLQVIRQLLSLLSQRERMLIVISLGIRLLLVGLDIVGIALVGVTVSLLSSTAIAEGSVTGKLISVVESTGLPNVYAIFASASVVFFVVKALASILLNQVVLRRVALLESSRADSLFRLVTRSNLDLLSGWTKKELSIALIDSLEMSFGKLVMSLSVVFGEALLILGIFVYLASVDFGLLVLVALYFALIGIVMNLAVANRTKNTALAMQSAGLVTTGAIFSFYDNLRQVAATGKQSFFEDQFHTGRRNLAFGSAKMSAMSVMPRYITEIALMLGFALLVIQRSVSSGNGMSASTIAIFVAGSFRIVASLLPLQGSFVLLKQIAGAGQMSLNLGQKLARYEAPSQVAQSRDASDGAVVMLSDVSYSYPGTSQVALHVKDFRIDEGEFVVVSGKSGAGKSTLADLILGLRTPTSGEVLVEGEVSSDFVANNPGKVAYVPQSCAIFDGNLAENISLEKDLSPQDMVKAHAAAEKAGLGPFVDELPDGLRTVIGESTRNLSGGQIQRIGLARALYTEPDLIILDEATSALDSTTEDSIMRTLSILKSRITVLAIAHKGRIFELADRGYTVENGEVNAT
jgi:ABC-type multidrug transport system fused ATPase/permease subunit